MHGANRGLPSDDAAKQTYDEIEDLGRYVSELRQFRDLGLFKDFDIGKMADMIRVNDLPHSADKAVLSGDDRYVQGTVLNVASVAAYSRVLYFQSLCAQLRGAVGRSQGYGGQIGLVSRTGEYRFCKNGPRRANVFKRSVFTDADEVARYGIGKAGKGKMIAIYSTLFKISV